MHTLPQLRKLERKYRDELVVIGVHSAKFDSEKASENIRKAVLRYEIEHPVVNDRDFVVWGQYAARAWPTIFFIDPQGKIIGKLEGELSFEAFDPVVRDMIVQFDAQGLIDRRALQFRSEAPKATSMLSFPGKILADGASNRLFIADSNHNRIVIATLDGVVTQIIGAGDAGLEDGAFQTAQFNHPQGLALADQVLYVADTENHAIRKVDLGKHLVETIAGTGAQALAFHKGGEACSVSLSSPWDVAFHRGVLYVAMAGMHQIWALDLARGTIHPYAGTGREGLHDGPLANAWLAQPSGLATDGQRLYFADSETSSIRVADFDPNGSVRTIVGLDLFEFGDVDGVGGVVRLQHPLGLCWYEGVLFVADTYNHKIKSVSPATRSATTLFGNGEPGHQDGAGREARLWEQGGLSAANGRLYIADTNNHAIRVADLASGLIETSELRWQG